MPRALIAPAAEQVVFQEFESPSRTEGQVRVKSLYPAAKPGTVNWLHIEPNPDHPNWDNTRIYDVCWRILAAGQVDCRPIVQPVVPFNDRRDAPPKIATQPAANIKLGVQF